MTINDQETLINELYELRDLLKLYKYTKGKVNITLFIIIGEDL